MDNTPIPSGYHREEHVFYNCLYHVIFCTKYRRNVLHDEIAEHLSRLLIDGQASLHYQLLNVDIAGDHVHLVLAVSPEASVCQTVGRIKAATSHVLRRTYQELRSRIPTLWTRVAMVTTSGEISPQAVRLFLEEQKKR